MLHATKVRDPRGTKRVMEWQRTAVIAVIILVVAVVLVLGWLSNQKTKATGDAQEVYYAGIQYVTGLATQALNPQYIGKDPKTAYLADNRPVLELVKEPVEGKFWLQMDCKKHVLNYVICRREAALPGGWMLEFTGVFPQQSDLDSGWRIYKPAPKDASALIVA